MGGPTEQKTDTVFIPPGEGRQTFSPMPLAWQVENFELGSDGILSSVVGPSILRVKAQAFISTNKDGFEGAEVTLDDFAVSAFPEDMNDTSFKTGVPQSIFSAELLNGGCHMLLFRIGSRLYSFNGSFGDADEVLVSDLTTSASPETMDQYVVINDKVVFFNGLDRPKVITYDGRVTPLGFSQRAPAPAVSSPGQPAEDDELNYYPNSSGYSWKGRIGTPGDELLGKKASLLKGNWYYYVQHEDINGDLSQISVPSEPATIHTNQADPFEGMSVVPVTQFAASVSGMLKGIVGKSGKRITANTLPDGTEVDDLTRRFLIRTVGEAPEHTVAIRLYRTPDTLHSDGVPRLVARIPGARQFFFDDNVADQELGFEWTETIPVPIFRVACAHQGRLIIANVDGNPGIVRRSQPGFPGTFSRDEYIFPDSTGDEITALASHNGQLVAFTKDSTYLIGSDFQSPVPLSTGIGCIAPKSVQSFGDGSLIWLAHDGFYGLSPQGALAKISDPINKIFTDELNKSRFKYACSLVDPISKEYRCCVAQNGSWENSLMLCFDGTYWRRQTLGIHIADMCVLRDHTKQSVAVGSDPRERNVFLNGTAIGPVSGSVGVRNLVDCSRIFVLNRQSTDYFGPSRRVRYRSNWLRSGEFGLVPTHVRTLYLGMMDAWVGKATVRFFRNGSWEPIAEINDLTLCGPDDGSGIVVDQAGQAVVGKARTRNSRVFWRQIPVGIENANSWAFEIEIVGNPSPEPVQPFEGVPLAGFSTADFFAPERKIWSSIYRNPKVGKEAFNEAIKKPETWELGRIRIFGFAFDLSVATQGTPLGRVPYRKDT